LTQKYERTSTLPAGVFEMTPGKAAFIRKIEGDLLDVFNRWGYQEIRTPAMEYMEAMSLGLGADELDLAFKMVDRVSGRMMVLRSDVTPQVARMAAGAMSRTPLPLRLCYVADVYRHPDDPSHPRRELIQAGVELIGINDPQADAEVIAVAVQALERMGLEGIRMSIGQVGFARGVFREAGFDGPTEDALVQAAGRKDRGAVEMILGQANAGKDVREAVLSLTSLSGNKDVLDQAGESAPCEECRAAVRNLRDVLELTVSYGVREDQLLVDLGELTAFRYHTGIVFTGYVSGTGRPVLSGGRYDRLTEKYGREAPATGFAIDILEVVDTVSRVLSLDPAIQYLLVNRTGKREEGLRISVKLRGKGRKVLCLIREIPDEDLGTFITAHRIGKVLVLEGDGLWILDAETGEKQLCSMVDL
jgi:ATP phosphoribosyltransferase regulatory subunit